MRPVLFTLAWLVASVAPASDRSQGPSSPPAPPIRTVVVAVIVNPDCELAGVTLDELRAIARLDRQFWPSNRRIALLLRPSSAPEMEVLQQTLYEMSAKELRRMWVEKLFAGRIPAIPTCVKADKAVTSAVAKLQNSLSFVCSDAVTDGVRVLPIDGKLPSDAGYALQLTTEQ